jgi:UDP-N-acetylmuramoyl-tripeptide--D-alanyl-D-alanine ligase
MSEATENRVQVWTAAEAAAATGGRATAPFTAFSVSIDSRTVAAGDLFIALQGPNFDGHGFVADALAKGAAGAVVTRIPDGVSANAPLLLAADTTKALEDLGRASRARSKARFIAVTGSVGKTSTKEALRHCLAALAPTYATQGNLNNHFGVPLSLARMPASDAFGVFELGMNHAGELGPLSRQVAPDVAIITTVEPVHIEHFPSIEGVADAKAEIFEGMSADGVAILNRDNPQYQRLANAAQAAGLTRIWNFGEHQDADARIIDVSLHATCSAVTAQIKGERVQYCLSLPGRHHVLNSLAVLLAVRAAGGDLHAAARAMSTLKPVKGRGLRKRVHLNQGAFTIIDESYNASPAAMRAAFDVLSRIDPGAGGRRVAVLGDMRELGDHAERLHAELAEPLKRAGIDTVYCCGPHMRAMYDRLPAGMRGGWTESSACLAAKLAFAVRPGDVVLVKGSAGTKMGPLVETLQALDARQADEAAAPADAPLQAMGG